MSKGAAPAFWKDEEWLQLALDTGRLGVWELDLERREMTSSALCKANFGRAANAPFTYQDLLAAIHPEERERVRAAVVRTLETGAAYAEEYRAVWPDGAVHWVSVRGRLVRGADGRTQKIVGISTDVTVRRRAEQALRESEERLRLAMESRRAADERRQRRAAVERFLAEAVALLASSLDYGSTLARITRLTVPALADWALLDLLQEDGTVRRVEVACADP